MPSSIVADDRETQQMSEWRAGARREVWELDAVSIWTRDERADESTPIFCAMASDWERREEDLAGDRSAFDTTRHHDRFAGVPRPRRGRGTSPDQRSQDNRGSRALADIHTMPPPPPRANTPEDELEHRAKHRREADVARSAQGGRHALPRREEDNGHHVCKVVRLIPRA